jgi:hypothetical protein
MSGDWIKVETCLPEKPEVWHIHDATGIDPDAIVGKLIKVWRWFDAHTNSGNAMFVSEELIDRLAGVPGFAQAMRHAGWLDVDGPSITVPNFDRHNGKTSKERALTAKRVAQHKARTNAIGNGKYNDEVTSVALPREEKRREDTEAKSEAKATVQQAGPCDGFGDFWALYPRKQAKSKAQAAWKRIKPGQRDALMAALPIQIAEDDGWVRGYIPLPATYLNGERWTDAITKPATTGTHNAAHQKLSAVERVRANAIAGEAADRARANGRQDVVGPDG